MFYDDYFEDEDVLDNEEELEDEDEDGETLEELDVDENGHVIEGRRRRGRRNRDDEYEPDFEESCPDAFGYDDSEYRED